MESSVQALVRRLRAQPLQEGCNATPLPCLTVYRCTGPRLPMPQLDDPYLYFVLDGSLRLYTPAGILDYAAGQYSVSAIDTPTAGSVLARSPQGDLLALAVSFTLEELLSVVLELEDGLAERILDASLDAAVMAQADRDILDALHRLVRLCGQPVQQTFLGQNTKREILFHALCGPCGKQFLQSSIHIQQAGDIYALNSWIKENFRQPFTVEELAEQRRMSVSLLHQRFKSAVGMGPLQCQKRLRLTEARRLMLDEGRNVTEAALDVGYESVSQFTREYKKMFGLPPKEDLLRLREQLEK